MFVDLAEASKVNWKDVDAVSAADWSKLTELPVAMPTLRRLLAELGVEPVENYKGASGVAGVGGAPSPAPSRAEEEEQEMAREAEAEARVKAEAKFRRAYTDAQIAANRAKVAPKGTGEAMYAAAEKGEAAELLKLVEPWFAHPVLNDYSGGGGDWTPLMTASDNNNIECVRVLVAQPGIELNKGHRDYQSTALYWASYCGHVNIVELLCSLPGIDCNKANTIGSTPHSWACRGYSGSNKEDRTRKIRAILEAKGAPAPAPARVVMRTAEATDSTWTCESCLKINRADGEYCQNCAKMRIKKAVAPGQPTAAPRVPDADRNAEAKGSRLVAGDLPLEPPVLTRAEEKERDWLRLQQKLEQEQEQEQEQKAARPRVAMAGPSEELGAIDESLGIDFCVLKESFARGMERGPGFLDELIRMAQYDNELEGELPSIIQALELLKELIGGDWQTYSRDYGLSDLTELLDETAEEQTKSLIVSRIGLFAFQLENTPSTSLNRRESTGTTRSITAQNSRTFRSDMKEAEREGGRESRTGDEDQKSVKRVDAKSTIGVGRGLLSLNSRTSGTEVEAELKLLAADPLYKYRRSYTEAQIAANRAKVAPEGTGEAIYAAAENGDAAELLGLVEPWFAHSVLNDYSGGDWTPLIIGSSNNNIECVRVLVAQPGIELNKGHHIYQQAALYCSSIRGHVNIVELLCSLPGIDCNKANTSGATPHSHACRAYSGADKEERTRKIRAILETKAKAQVEAELKLLAADPLAKYRRSYTEAQIAANRAKVAPEGTGEAIYAAAEKGREAELLGLVEPWFAHPVLNDYSGDGGIWTPLIIASSDGLIECVRVMVAQPGIELNKVDRDHQSTALYWASCCGHVDIVELLCSLPGIDCNKANKDGRTPHSHACWKYFLSDKMERAWKIRAILEAKGVRR